MVKRFFRNQQSGRPEMKLAPRDNVYLEFALYGGILSVSRSFFMMDEKCKAASDLNGVTLFYYNDQEDSIERCCEQLKEYIREEERESAGSVCFHLQAWRSVIIGILLSS